MAFPGVHALELERQSDEEGCAPDAPARLVAPRLGGTHTTAWSTSSSPGSTWLPPRMRHGTPPRSRSPAAPAS